MSLKQCLAITAALCIALVLCDQKSSAAYLGLGLQLHTTVSIGGADRSVWRLYIVFDDPEDHGTSMAGSEVMGSMVIQSFTSDGELGGAFVNPAGGGNRAPSQEAIAANPDVEWDTFATIGVAVDDGYDWTIISPGFPQHFGGQFIIGNAATATNAAWLVPGPMEQSRAGGPNGVNGTFMNGSSVITGMGVLCAQLTVNAGEGVRGTAAVGLALNDGIAGGFSIPNQAFEAIPVPSAVVLLAIASLAPRRRRIGA